jgi:hypothetical protein
MLGAAAGWWSLVPPSKHPVLTSNSSLTPSRKLQELFQDFGELISKFLLLRRMLNVGRTIVGNLPVPADEN